MDRPAPCPHIRLERTWNAETDYRCLDCCEIGSWEHLFPPGPSAPGPMILVPNLFGASRPDASPGIPVEFDDARTIQHFTIQPGGARAFVYCRGCGRRASVPVASAPTLGSCPDCGGTTWSL